MCSYLVVCSTTYSTGNLVRTREAGRGWISYLKMGAFYTKFECNYSRLSYFLKNLGVPSLLLVFVMNSTLVGVLHGTVRTHSKEKDHGNQTKFTCV